MITFVRPKLNNLRKIVAPSTDTHSSYAPPHCTQFPTSSRRWKSEPTTAAISPKKNTTQPPPDPDSDYVDSGEEEEEEGESRLALVDISSLPPPSKRKVRVTRCLYRVYCCLPCQRRWRCEIPPSEVQSWVNHNKHITDKLEVLVSIHSHLSFPFV